MRFTAAAIILLLAISAPSAAQELQGSWSKAAAMSAPRSELQAITVGEKIYVIGGNVVGFISCSRFPGRIAARTTSR